MTLDAGQLWNFQPNDIDIELTGIEFLNANEGWTVGEQGVLLHTADGGSTWKQWKSSTTKSLWNLDFVTPSLGWAVGAEGTILRYRAKG